jgi:hypothetical protein
MATTQKIDDLMHYIEENEYFLIITDLGELGFIGVQQVEIGTIPISTN